MRAEMLPSEIKTYSVVQNLHFEENNPKYHKRYITVINIHLTVDLSELFTSHQYFNQHLSFRS